MRWIKPRDVSVHEHGPVTPHAVNPDIRFAEAYPADGETPRVRVMQALICARYLGRPDEARAALVRIGGGLSDPEQRGLAEDLARELGVSLLPEG